MAIEVDNPADGAGKSWEVVASVLHGIKDLRIVSIFFQSLHLECCALIEYLFVWETFPSSWGIPKQ